MRTAIVALLIASPALAQNASLSEGTITCSSPVSPNDSAKSLMLRYGGEAVIQDDLPGAEDLTYKGVVLSPRAMDRRIEIWFTDDTLNQVAGLGIPETVKTSRWNVAGVTIGSSLAQVQRINGKPFLVNGFEWDFGGWVADWKGGIFGRPLRGGCKVALRFGTDAITPKGLSGEGVKVFSDNATLVKLRPVVTGIVLNFGSR